MKTGAINIYSSKLEATNFRLILDGLLSNGWSTNKNELIVYVVDELYELLSMPYSYDNLELIKEKLYNNIMNGLNASLDLVYGNNEAIISLHFVNDINDEKIMITIPEKIIYIDNTEIIDFSWYLSKIKEVFTILNFYRLTCDFD